MRELETESVKITRSQRDYVRGIQDEVEQNGARRPTVSEVLEVAFSVKHRHYVVDTLTALWKCPTQEDILETVSKLRSENSQ